MSANKKDRIDSFDQLKKLIKRYYISAKVRSKLGLKVAWVTSGAPVELLLPFGIYPIYPESHGALCAARHDSPRLMEVAERRGYSADLCSYALTDIGSAITGESPVGGLPRPDLLVCCNNICGTVLKWYEALADLYKVPLVLIDTPFVPDGPGAPGDVPARSVKYVRAQLEEAIEVFEKVSGKKYRVNKLEKVLDRARESLELWRQILKVNTHRPAPMTCFDAFILMNPIVTLRGTRTCVKFYKRLLAEMESRVREKQGRIPDEQLRIVWDNIPIWHQMRELSRFFRDRNVCLVADTYTNAWVEHDMKQGDPLDVLAEIYTGVFLNRGLRSRAAILTNLVERYDADGIILHSNKSCKPYTFGQFDIKRMVSETTGKPSYLLEADHVDPRYYNEAKTLFALESFLESIPKPGGP